MSILISSGLISISPRLNLRHHFDERRTDVCRRWFASKGDSRTGDATPRSAFRRPYAYPAKRGSLPILYPLRAWHLSQDFGLKFAHVARKRRKHRINIQSPILRFGAARAGVNRKDRVVVIVFAGEKQIEFERGQVSLRALALRARLPRQSPA